MVAPWEFSNFEKPEDVPPYLEAVSSNTELLKIHLPNASLEYSICHLILLMWNKSLSSYCLFSVLIITPILRHFTASTLKIFIVQQIKIRFLQGAPWMMLLILAEMFIDIERYQLNDTVTSICAGLCSMTVKWDFLFSVIQRAFKTHHASEYFALFIWLAFAFHICFKKTFYTGVYRIKQYCAHY